MFFFRRWHAHHESRHHFGGHGRHGHPFGSHADGFAHLLLNRVGAKLDLDDEQRRRFALWIEQIQQQRDALKRFARGPELGGLLSGEQFPREPARQMLDSQLDALRAAGPGLVNAFADFFDALDTEQRQALRFMMRRFDGARQRHAD